MAQNECKKKEGTAISDEVADALILSSFPGITPWNIGKLTMRQYNSLLNQAINMRNFKMGEKFEMLTYLDKQKQLRKELEEL